jgi:hypothetical protein
MDEVVAMSGSDEARIAGVVGSLGREARTAFAAACAERIWPLVERYASAVSLPLRDRQVLRDALDAAWGAAMGAGSEEDVRFAQEAADALVPCEDDAWVVESGYAQNGIAAIAYAARTWLTDDPQEAVWAARQVYEAADYAAQQQNQAAVARVVSADVEAELAHTPVVQASIRGIFDDLAAAGRGSAEIVRRRASDAADAFVKLFP